MRSPIAVLIATLLALPAAAKQASPASEKTEGRPTIARLDAAKRTVFSQFGEDGVIEEIFEIIEPTHDYVVEFGAHNGVRNSNARNLIVNHGWKSLLIEGEERLAKALHDTYEKVAGVKTLQAWVWPGNVEILFEEAGVPKDFDLLVIDIDSNDYYVWRAIHEFRPKVVMIECNPAYPPPQLMVVDYHPMNYWDGDTYIGASLDSMDRMAKKKGYELAYCMPWGPNCFWVDRQYFDRFGIADNSPQAMFRMWVTPRGPLEHAPDDTLEWKAFEIPKKLILDR